ncbi:F-box/WD repeat-containing protein 9-like [Asterias amurensis]|uniref:F-box/WD repeat-containing protein 9-like n=1 Tax=Asterias amurensis TaxID=7602 RepID=UPI003AB2B3FF
MKDIATDEVDNDEDCTFPDDEMSQLTLLTLPPELLLNIISYLSARFVVHRLSLVCKELHQLISDDATWKIRISKRWPNQYPIIPVEDEEFDWKLACMEREEQWHLWTATQDMEYFSLTNGHFGEIDTVHLMQNGEICVSGSRDRSFCVWDLRRLDQTNQEKSIKAAQVKSTDGHKGWVWHVTSKDNVVCTSSWDQWINLWDANYDFERIQGFKGSSAFLCSILHEREVIAGAYDKHVYVFDKRDRNEGSTLKLRMHKKPVLAIASDENYIISGSEDSTINVFDRRAAKTYKTIKLDKFPLCMSYDLGQLWVGKKNGQVDLLDPTHGEFDVVQTYDVGHTGKVTDITHSLGSIITCSTDKKIRIHEPNHNPSTFRVIDCQTSLASLNTNTNVLAAAGSDCCVKIWRPIREPESEEAATARALERKEQHVPPDLVWVPL